MCSFSSHYCRCGRFVFFLVLWNNGYDETGQTRRVRRRHHHHVQGQFIGTYVVVVLCVFFSLLFLKETSLPGGLCRIQ